MQLSRDAILLQEKRGGFVEKRTAHTAYTLLAGVPVELTRKNIRRIHLRVRGEDGQVTLSAPPGVPRSVLERFVGDNADWIGQKRRELQALPKRQPHRYRTGETIWLWGERRILVESAERMEGFRLQDGRAFLWLPPGAAEARRIHLAHEAYRRELARAIGEVLPGLSAQTGLAAEEWRIKNMKTRWGTCNIRARRIWLNLQLAAKPRRCLEYVLLHELLHLVERYHNRRFYALLDRYMPSWRETRSLLNRSQGNL